MIWEVDVMALKEVHMARSPITLPATLVQVKAIDWTTYSLAKAREHRVKVISISALTMMVLVAARTINNSTSVTMVRSNSSKTLCNQKTEMKASIIKEMHL